MDDNEDILLNEIDTLSGMHTIGTPDEISREIVRAEKEMASETLKLLKSRQEKQKAEWRDIIKEKERCILELEEKIEKAESVNKSLSRQLNQEKQIQIEQIKIQAKEIELRKAKERKRWGLIEEEIKKFRTETLSAQKRVYDEHEHSKKIRDKFDAIIGELKERICESEENNLKISEQIALKEQGFLNEKSRMDEEIHILSEEVLSQKNTINDEKLFFKKSLEKKENELAMVQKALQETIINLNKERAFREEQEERMIGLRKVKEDIEIKLQRADENIMQNKVVLEKARSKEQAFENKTSKNSGLNMQEKESNKSEEQNS